MIGIPVKKPLAKRIGIPETRLKNDRDSLKKPFNQDRNPRKKPFKKDKDPQRKGPKKG